MRKASQRKKDKIEEKILVEAEVFRKNPIKSILTGPLRNRNQIPIEYGTSSTSQASEIWKASATAMMCV